MTIIEITVVALIVFAIGVFAVSIYLRKPDARTVLADKFQTVSALKDHLEYQTLLENADAKQRAAIRSALNTTFGINTVSEETANETIDAAAGVNANNIAATETILLRILNN